MYRIGGRLNSVDLLKKGPVEAFEVSEASMGFMSASPCEVRQKNNPTPYLASFGYAEPV